MSFGLNQAQIIGRLGADATVSNLASGGRVANMSIATDEGYIDRQSGQRVDRVEWHKAVTFQIRPDRHAGEAREEGPLGLRRGQAPDPQVAQGRRGQRQVLDRDHPRPRLARAVPRSRDQRQRLPGARRRDRTGRRRRRRSTGGRLDALLTGLKLPPVDPRPAPARSRAGVGLSSCTQPEPPAMQSVPARASRGAVGDHRSARHRRCARTGVSVSAQVFVHRGGDSDSDFVDLGRAALAARRSSTARLRRASEASRG